MGSFDGRWKIVRELVAFGRELGFDDDAVDVLEVGDFLESVIFGVVFQEFIEGVAHQQCVFELWQLS